MLDIKNENISANQYHKLNISVNFSFSKQNSINQSENNPRQFGKNVKNNFNIINEKYLLCHPNKKIQLSKFFISSNTNFPTKPKIQSENHRNNENTKIFDEIRNEQPSLLFDLKNLLPSSENRNEIKKTFNIDNKIKIPFEIDYFFSNPTFNYDFLHQNENNSNYEYINENFIDILLSSDKNKMILNENIKPLNNIQNEITFSKRNILLSWLTEVDFKFIKSQNILFITMKLIDRLLYKKNLNLNEFQLIGILCMNLALKMENHYKVFYTDEIIKLIGFREKNSSIDNINLNLHKKIINIENKICDELDFDFETSTAVLILDRLIQILNIQNKNHFTLFQKVSYFFLEVSLYNEYFYELSDFTKALSSLLLTKEILKRKNIKTGFHSYFVSCARIFKDEIKRYFDLCKATINELKTYKYGNTIFTKYKNEEFNKVVDDYLCDFIDECK